MKNVDGQTDRQIDVGHINLIGGLVTRNPPKNRSFIKICVNQSTNISKVTTVHYTSFSAKKRTSMYVKDI